MDQKHDVGRRATARRSIAGDTFLRGTMKSTKGPLTNGDQIGASRQNALTGDRFGRFAADASCWLGSKWAFSIAIFTVLLWALSGPIFHYSNNWQLVINTGTTIVTFLMVFLIQNTQNREARAMNLKLDELISAISTARNQMLNIEKLSDIELDKIQAHFAAIKSAQPPSPSENA